MSAVDLVRDGFVLAFFTMIPVVVAAAAAAIVAGALAAKVGVRDPIVATIARAAAVVITLTLVGGSIVGPVVDFAGAAWTHELIEAGR